MIDTVGAAFVVWAVFSPPAAAPEPDAHTLLLSQLQMLDDRVGRHADRLDERCVQEGQEVADDAALALRAGALYQEAAEILLELMADPRLSARQRGEYELALSRQYEGRARMLLKAHACGPDWALLEQAALMLQRAKVAANGHETRLAEIKVVEEEQAQRRQDFPRPMPRVEPPPKPCPVCAPPSVRVEPPPWPERLVLRFEAGVGMGRLVRRDVGIDVEDGYTHWGPTLGASLLGRVRLSPRWTLLFGPSYTYWQADKKDDVGGDDEKRVYGAKYHHFAGRLEASIGLGRRWRDVVSLHPGLEMGLQYAAFSGHYDYPGDANDKLKSMKVLEENRNFDNLGGSSFVGSLGVCFASGSLCLAVRVGHAPGTEWTHPTLAFTGGVDIFGVVRSIRARRPRRK